MRIALFIYAIFFCINCFGPHYFSSEGEGTNLDGPVEFEHGDEIQDPPAPVGPITISSSPLITTAETGDEITYLVDATSSINLVLTYSISNAPIGMRIRENTGKLTWTPVTGQVSSGAVTITVTDENSNTETQNLNITVTPKAMTYSKGYFVAHDGDQNNAGTPESPVDTISRACNKHAAPGDFIYVRGGIYRNTDYGDENASKVGIETITCEGSLGSPITIRPWGNEMVKFEFDGTVAFRIKGFYTTFEKFEIQGINNTSTFEEAVAEWWTPFKFGLGNGIVINGHNIIVKNNVVHHTPGLAISARSTDYVTIENNIVYNTVWWTTQGTTAIGVEWSNTIDNSTTQNFKIVGNLVFGNESRIYSRVWNNGYAILTIDEGTAILVQLNEGTYRGGYLIKDNFLFYNGKGIEVLGADNVEIINNTLYQNGTTIGGANKGLFIQKAENLKIKNNLIEVYGDGNAYNVKDSTNVINEGNFIIGDNDISELPSGVTKESKIFTDPKNLDFSILSEITSRPGYVDAGASMATWNKLKTMADEYGIEIKPTGWLPDLAKMNDMIIENPPKGASIHYNQDCIGNIDTKKVCIKNIPDGHVSGQTEFELRLKH